MKLPHCPHLDRLGRELIEAYRSMDDHDAFCRTTDMDHPDDVTKIHLLMAQHRNACPICRQIAFNAPRANTEARYASR
jgi:hypothetical protein